MNVRVLALVGGLSALVGVGCEKKQDASADETQNKEKKKAKSAEEKTGAADESGDREADKNESAESGETTCKSVASHAVGVMVDELGDESMIQKEHVPELTKGCEKTNSLETKPKVVECMKNADSQKALVECEGGNKLLKTWLTKGGK